MTVDPQRHLRLIWPQWQGAGSSSVRALAPEFDFDTARRGYTVGTRVLQAILPEHEGPTAVVEVPLDGSGLAEQDGVEAKQAVLAQLNAALALIAQAQPTAITTLGGDCAVSLAPFSSLLASQGDDLAVVWIDSHPDLGIPELDYNGHHAMVLAALLGQGDPEVIGRLPATVNADRVALVGMHDWTDPAVAELATKWGVTVIEPDQLRSDGTALLDWLDRIGAGSVLIHFDVDTIDSDEVQFGLGADRGGLTTDQARRLVRELADSRKVVGLTIAEYIPRQVMRLQRLLEGFPLL